MFDWQTLTVTLIILAACAYVARRGWGRLRSFRATGAGDSASCATGCGKCGDTETKSTTAKTLIQIGRPNTTPRN